MAISQLARVVLTAEAIYDNLLAEGRDHGEALREVVTAVYRVAREQCAEQVRDELGGVLREWGRPV